MGSGEENTENQDGGNDSEAAATDFVNAGE